MMSHSTYRVAAAFTALAALCSCSASGTSPATPTQADLAANTLAFSVGTANIFGDVPASARSGLNVVVSYRQNAGSLHPGDSAVLVSSPTLTGAMTLPANAGTGSSFDATSTALSGPAPSEAGSSSMRSTAQGGSTVTTFGTSGGAFGLGLEPFDYTNAGTVTVVAPYPVPLYDRVASDPNAFVPWGGPPAFDLGGNGLSVVGSASEPAGQAGVSEGIDVFAGVSVRTGNYSLSVAVPANTGLATATASATLKTTALLPPISPPTVALDGRGGGTFTAALPAGVTEAYVQITDFGPRAASGGAPAGCNAAPNAPVYYTLAVSGTNPAGMLPDAIGPNGTPSLCTPALNAAANAGAVTPGDIFTVQTIGFDYPLYENSYRSAAAGVSPAPRFAGAKGQSDVTISSSTTYQLTASGAGASKIGRIK